MIICRHAQHITTKYINNTHALIEHTFNTCNEVVAINELNGYSCSHLHCIVVCTKYDAHYTYNVVCTT